MKVVVKHRIILSYFLVLAVALSQQNAFNIIDKFVSRTAE